MITITGTVLVQNMSRTRPRSISLVRPHLQLSQYVVEEASETTSRIELPVNTLSEESLIRHQLFPPQAEEFSMYTPAVSSVDPALNAEKDVNRAARVPPRRSRR